MTLLISLIVLAQETSSESPKIWTLNDGIVYAVENNITIKDAALILEQATVDYSALKPSKLPNLYGTA